MPWADLMRRMSSLLPDVLRGLFRRRACFRDALVYQYLNAEIHKYEECAPCQIEGIMRLRGTDESGCNWSGPGLRSSGQHSDVCLPIAERVVAEAMKKFNLK